MSPRCPLEDDLDPYLRTERSAKTDQTAWMRRLIRVLAWRTCDIVGNAVYRLK